MLPDNTRLICNLPAYHDVRSVIREIYGLNVYELLFKPKRGYKVVDIGAHVGVYALKVARQIDTEGLLVAVEPEPDNYKLLVKNVRINNAKNIIPLKLAISNRDGRLKLYKSLNSSLSHSIMFHVSEEWIETDTITLDGLLSKLGINHVDLVKIDAEGSEIDILRGAKKLLANSGVKIVIATYHTPTQARDIKRYLKAVDFNVKLMKASLPFGIRKKETTYLYAWRDEFATKTPIS